MPFRSDVSLMSYVEDPQAVERLVDYRDHYTGKYFDELAGLSQRDRIAPSDLVAVTMLSVEVPARAAIALLYDTIPQYEGRIGECLRAIPMEATLWDEYDFIGSKPAQDLWTMLRTLNGMGRTKTSKILAAKRPNLFPVFDSVVGRALFEDSERDFVLKPWREEFAGSKSATLRELCDVRARSAGYPNGFSPLRVLDILIWMKEKSTAV